MWKRYQKRAAIYNGIQSGKITGFPRLERTLFQCTQVFIE